ncbi:MAG: hypothetical protein EB059_07865 [Alphaproteobacteria bacterium]|nr:hypothetical protein [Alphaproteobacteria bacterium]
MRIYFLLFAILLGAANIAQAQDIAIKPSAPALHPVDLGIRSQPRAPAAQQPALQQPAIQQPVEQQPVEQQPVEQQPAQQPVQAQPSTPHANNITSTPSDIQNLSQVPPRKPGDVQVITLGTDDIPMPPGTGPNVFSASVQAGALGPVDKSTTAQILGISDQQVASICVFEHLVIGTSNNFGTAVPLGQKTSGEQHFSGDITGVMVFPALACRKLRQPVSGTVIDQGGYYKVALQSVSCPTPPHGGSLGVSFRYTGDGKGECLYR